MRTSGVITITTDFGLSDPFVAMMKGVIVSINPDVRLIDITHQIRAGSIFQAAIIIHEAYSFFPEGTIHLAVVDPGVGSGRTLLGLKTDGHLFVGPDNGIFWPVLETHPDAEIVHLNESRYFLSSVTPTFHGRDVFAPVAAHLSLGVDLRLMGEKRKSVVRLRIPKPKKRRGVLFGQVMRVDNFGNLITNISKAELESFLKSKQPVIKVSNLVIDKFRQTYADAEGGEILAIMNSSDLLEIAVNMGRASDYIGMDFEEIIGTEVRVNIADGAL